MVQSGTIRASGARDTGSNPVFLTAVLGNYVSATLLCLLVSFQTYFYGKARRCSRQGESVMYTPAQYALIVGVFGYTAWAMVRHQRKA